MTEAVADWTGHRIEGFAIAAEERGLDGAFACPLLSEILPGLWMGGWLPDVTLPDSFSHVVSLYPWGRYSLSSLTERDEYRMYDHDGMPDLEVLEDVAGHVNRYLNRGGTVLVHCQAGLNRSGLVTALALIRRGLYTASDAIALLREKRSPMVLCNQTFENWLLTQV